MRTTLHLSVREITETHMTVEQAREAGLIADWPRSCWTENMARGNPQAIIREYAFDGIVGGHIWQEVADFHTLAEFAECAAATASQIWHDYLLEAAQ